MNNIYILPVSVQDLQHKIDNFLMLNEASELPAGCVADTLEAMEGELEEMQIAIAASIKNIESDIEQMKSYISVMEYRKENSLDVKEKLMEYLVKSMIKSSSKKIHTAQFDINLRKSHRVKIQDKTRLDKYIKSTVVESIDKLKLKADLKKGEVLGAMLQERNYLIIK